MHTLLNSAIYVCVFYLSIFISLTDSQLNVINYSPYLFNSDNTYYARNECLYDKHAITMNLNLTMMFAVSIF